MTFAGGFFAEEIEDRVAKMFVVQIEVSFVSTRRESDKPEKINKFQQTAALWRHTFHTVYGNF